MTIAVHISASVNEPDVSSHYLYRSFITLAKKYPHCHVVFIFDDPFNSSFIKQKNITVAVSRPVIKNRLLQHYFYQYKIPNLLKKFHATCLVSNDVCSLRTTIPQCLIINDLIFLQKKNLLNSMSARYLKKNMPAFIKKADNVLVTNPYLKTLIEKTYNTEGAKISVVPPSVQDNFIPLDHESADAIRERISEGNQYFIFYLTPDAAQNTMTVLKAFSIFKKWQKSAMNLIVLVSANVKDEAIQKISSYKYKADVKILDEPGEHDVQKIIASAYAAIHLSLTEVNDFRGLNSIACGVPVIASGNDFNQGLFGNAALYVSSTEKDISDKMMLVYKDEKVKAELIRNGNVIALQHRKEKCAAELWQVITALQSR